MSENLPLPYAVYLKVNPPYAGYPQYTPKSRLFAQRSDREPFQDEEVAHTCEDEEREAYAK